MSLAKFAVITDLHYFSPSLTDGGRAYELRSGSDQKCLLESGAIIDETLKNLSADETVDAVIIPGDLSDDGELCSHLELVEKLKDFAKYKKVFVTTATHDFCCDNNAKKYFGDTAEGITETADIPKLRELYDQFGPDQSISKYENFNGLCSYVVQLGEGVRLFALNDDQDGNGSSGFSDEHFNWIIEQMEEAKKAGDRIVAMQHHVVLQHYTKLLTKGGICCGNREKVAEAFATNGCEVLFVGHSHMQNITEYTSQNNNKMVQVNVGSLCGYPAPIFKVHMDDEYVSMRTDYLRSFEYEGETLTTWHLLQHSQGLIANILNPAANGNLKEFCDRLKALGVKSEIPEKLFFIEKKLCSYINTVSIGSLAKTVNLLTFGKGINKSAAEEIAEKIMIELAYEIFMNLFDGGFHRYKKGSPTYTVVTDFVSIPSRLLHKIPFIPEKITGLTDEIVEFVQLLMDDKTENNYIRFRTEKRN